MVKVMGNGDVLRCLAKNLFYHCIKTGLYLADVHCDRKCVPFGKNDLCLAFRSVIVKSDADKED